MNKRSREPKIRLHHGRLASIPDRERDLLMDGFCVVAVAALTPGSSVEESWVSADWKARRDWIIENCSAQWATSGTDVVGFIVYRTMRLAGRPAVYLNAASVLPEYQSRGVAFAINARIVFRSMAAARFAPVVVVAHILNPIAMKGWWSRLNDQKAFYPQITGVEPPVHLREIAEEFAAEVDEGLEFDPATGVVKGRHPVGSRPARESGHPGIDSLYQRHVCLDAGDTVVMVVDLSHRTILAGFGELLRAIHRSATVALHPARRTQSKRTAARSST